MHCPGWPVCLNHLPGHGCSVSWVHCKSTISGLSCVSSGELILAATLLADVNHPGSQEDLVSNWEPAHSSVQDAISGSEIAPCLQALAVACLSLFLWCGDGLVHSRLALLWCSLSPLFCEWARLHLRLELFKGMYSPFFSCLWLSHSLGCYLKLAPSVYPQGIQAQSLP